MRTYKLTISYDGSRYQGWQRQATTDNTIQYILEWSIGKLVGYRVHIDGSGRTDAGVHARGQVASVKLSKLYDTKELKDSLNRYLPEDIRIVKVELAKNGFHARKSAKGKKYEYYIDCREKPDVFSRRYCYHYPEKLDIEAMRDATRYLIGPKNLPALQMTRNVKIRFGRLRILRSSRAGKGKNYLLRYRFPISHGKNPDGNASGDRCRQEGCVHASGRNCGRGQKPLQDFWLRQGIILKKSILLRIE